MSGRIGCDPGSGGRGQEEEEDKGGRPNSGVFLSPPSSRDQCTGGVIRADSNRGYSTSTSSAGLDPERSGGATFYISQSSEPRDPEWDAAAADDDNDPGDWPDRRNEQTSATVFRIAASEPLQIPGASSFHRAQDEAIQLMDSTPPRSYNTHPLADISSDPDCEMPPESGLACRFSTGCLTNMPVIVQALAIRSRRPCREFLMTGLRVASGHLQVSNRRVDLHRKRTISERVVSDDITIPRDRSLSVPDIGLQHQLIQQQCGQELRKISDEFFQEFHQRKGRTSRARQSEPAHSSSYPGTLGSEHGLWQAIIQSFSPARVRSSASSSQLSSLSHLLSEDRATKPRIVITKQSSDQEQ